MESSVSITRVSTDEKLITMWLHGRAAKTQEAYTRDAKYFFNFTGKTIRECKLEDLQAYCDHLNSLDLKPGTIRRKLNALKSLWTFATKLNYVGFNVAAALRLPKDKQSLAGRILKQSEVLRLINKAKSGRDRALLKLLYATGMRISEACSLKWQDFSDRDTGEVQVSVLGKGEKLRTVLVPASVWIEVEVLKGSSTDDFPVFASVRGKALTRGIVHGIIKEAAELAGVNPKVSAHWFRHAHCQHALAKGAPIHLVRDSVGHSNISVTNVYLESNPEDSSSNYLGL